MLTHDVFLPWTLGLGLFLGLWGIVWARRHPMTRAARWGKCLFVVTFLILGTATFLAAVNHLDGLAPLGMLSGLLVVGMLWEGPRRVAPLAENTDPPLMPRLAPDGSRAAG